jgi:hypothetical protein
MKKDYLNSIMWVNHYDQLIKSIHFHSPPLLKIRVWCSYFYSFAFTFCCSSFWAWGEQSLRRLCTCTRSVVGNLFIFTVCFTCCCSSFWAWTVLEAVVHLHKVGGRYLVHIYSFVGRCPCGLSHSIQLLEDM